MIKIVDISCHNGDVDFNILKRNGVQGVILRAGYGRSSNQKDSRFEINYKKAKQSGLMVGAYWFSYASDRYDALEEADAFYTCIHGKSFELPIYYDVEDDTNSNYYFSKKTKSECDNIVRNFCLKMEEHGYFIGVYSCKNILETKLSIDVRRRFALWVAHYAEKCGYNDTYYGVWQYSKTGKFKGLSGCFDLNIMYPNYPYVIKTKHFNNM